MHGIGLPGIYIAILTRRAPPKGVPESMNVMLAKAFVILLPSCLLFSGAIIFFVRGRSARSFLQVLGAGCLVVVALTHICEAFHLFPWMKWGLEHSAGHYLDLSSAVLGVTLFPIGYLLDALSKRNGA